MSWALRSIQFRIAALIFVSMMALIVFLVVDAVRERERELDRASRNLQSLAYFAARGERERFEATDNFLTIASQAASLRDIAKSPDDPALFDACTRALFVSDQLVPGTRFSLWDTDGRLLCSSQADARGSYTAQDRSWFQIALESGQTAAGGYEVVPHTGIAAIGFGRPIRDEATGQTIAVLSAAVTYSEDDPVLLGRLPESGRYHVVDQDGVVLYSTEYEAGHVLSRFSDAFGGLQSYLETGNASGSGRQGAAVRITDADEALVAAIVSADPDVIVAPLPNKLFDNLWPVALLTLCSVLAAWLVGQLWIVRPIGVLGKTTRQLEGGDLSARVPRRFGVTEFDRLADRFNEMAEVREDAARAKDEFLGLVSHELKTPITMALGMAEVLHKRGDELSPADRETATEDIVDSTRTLSLIVDNLLALARLEQGRALDVEPVSLLHLTNSVAEETLRRYPGRSVVVNGDRRTIALAGEVNARQILQNLIGNAIKYSSPDQPVEVNITEEQGMAVIRVLDRGPGVDESEAAAIFEPFYRSERTVSVTGMGIGLSVCARLVTAMGGEIWCENRADGGCEFGFRLPFAVVEDVVEPEEGLQAIPVPA